VTQQTTKNISSPPSRLNQNFTCVNRSDDVYIHLRSLLWRVVHESAREGVLRAYLSLPISTARRAGTSISAHCHPMHKQSPVTSYPHAHVHHAPNNTPFQPPDALLHQHKDKHKHAHTHTHEAAPLVESATTRCVPHTTSGGGHTSAYATELAYLEFCSASAAALGTNFFL